MAMTEMNYGESASSLKIYTNQNFATIGGTQTVTIPNMSQVVAVELVYLSNNTVNSFAFYIEEGNYIPSKLYSFLNNGTNGITAINGNEISVTWDSAYSGFLLTAIGF